MRDNGIKLNTIYRQTYTWTSRRAINRRIDINADEQTYRLKTNRRRDRQRGIWACGQTDAHTDRHTDRQKDGQTDSRKDRRTNRGTDEYSLFKSGNPH